MPAADTLAAAVRHHQAGQLDEADRLYRKVLAADPKNAHALHLRGALAHAAGRNEDAVKLIGRALAVNEQMPDFHYNIALALWALGRRAEAIAHWTRTVALNPSFAAARMNLGNALRDEGRSDEAIAQHLAAVKLWPQAPPAHNSLGLSLAKAGRHEEAIPHYNRAIALDPRFADACLNLAVSHAARDEAGPALTATMRGLELRDTPEGRAMFVNLVSGLQQVGEDPTLRRLLTRALAEGWDTPSMLAPAARALVRHGPLAPSIERAVQAWPERLPEAEFFRPEGLARVDDPLLLALLEAAAVCDAEMEEFLAACRFALLEAAETGVNTAAFLPIACALARQCFINEYVYATGTHEEARAAKLRERLDNAIVSGSPAPLLIAAVAAYFPLHELAGAAALMAKPWPAAMAELLNQQVREPIDAAAQRTAIPALTPIEDGVSRAVQAQYEQSPYPRWVRTGAPRRYADLDTFLRETFPLAPHPEPHGSGTPDILIAGCGTGQHAIATAQQFEGAPVLAIDLSRASLAYAAMKTRPLGLPIEYAQADIMRLGSLERRFDLIESSGVLHHLADAYAGWRVLLSLLRPGGCMRIALYSETARRGVVAARTLIAQSGYGSTPAEIRRFRRDLMQRDDETARNIMCFNDFYTTSECRDLLFHVQEHRMTLPAVKQFLAEQKLQFIGFEIDRGTARTYTARFPADAAMTDLNQWHIFEQDNPDTFAAMYRFWVRPA
jgi:Flp pilus assembly protein TadD/SAM-dependent methyltransferase